MKYYFISFMYGASEKKLENDVIDFHPFEWQRYANKSYRGQYILINWKEITMEEYKKYNSLKDMLDERVISNTMITQGD